MAFPHDGNKFQPGQSGNPAGRPVGSYTLEQRIQRILENGIELPESLKAVIRAQCGDDKTAADAMVIVGLLQALQGDAGWAKLLMEHGYGKPLQRNDNKNEHSGSVTIHKTWYGDKPEGGE